jgi:hypothetical protein
MKALVIANTQIRRDDAGRFCLNDVHEASGSDKRYQPANWLRLNQTQELILELKKGRKNDKQFLTSEELEPVVSAPGGYGGTYVVKELVYAYATWRSAAFFLIVIRAYDALITASPSGQAAETLDDARRHRAARMYFDDARRTLRAARVPWQQAVARALAFAERKTGIDLSAEYQIDLGIDALPVQFETPADSEIALFLDHWREGKLGIAFAPILSRKLFQRYAQWCTDNNTRILREQWFVHAVKRQWGKQCNPRRRWPDDAGVVHGPHGFIDPSCSHFPLARQSSPVEGIDA